MSVIFNFCTLFLPNEYIDKPGNNIKKNTRSNKTYFNNVL